MLEAFGPLDDDEEEGPAGSGGRAIETFPGKVREDGMGCCGVLIPCSVCSRSIILQPFKFSIHTHKTQGYVLAHFKDAGAAARAKEGMNGREVQV